LSIFNYFFCGALSGLKKLFISTQGVALGWICEALSGQNLVKSYVLNKMEYDRISTHGIARRCPGLDMLGPFRAKPCESYVLK
jgi:hypothetical protein